MRRTSATTVVAVLLFVISTLSATRVFGQESFDAQTLKGISAVQVAIEDLSDSAKALGLDEETIQTDVELKLRRAGMRVSSTPASPFVYISVTVVGGASVIRIELNQSARLLLSGELWTVTTWSQTYLEVNSTTDSVRGHIKDLADAFLNDWLSVNPKK
jgi:hypothetical protein